MIFPQIVFTFALALGVTAIVFDKCTLSKELIRVGAKTEELDDWMCLIEHESTFNTSAVGSKNLDGSQDWGLFQVSDIWWCKSESRNSSNVCGIACQDLLSDDIKIAFDCALMVKKVHGFSAWVGWVDQCQNYVHKDENYC